MTKNEIDKLKQKVSLLRAEGKYKETIKNCYELLKYGAELQDYKAVMTSYINLAASYYCIGDIEEALRCVSYHKEICDKYGDAIDQLSSYNTMFLLYECNKNNDKCKETLEKSIALGIELEQYNIVSNGYSNYSHICYRCGEYEKALEIANLGLQMAQKHEPFSEILEFRVKLNIAKAHIALKHFDVAKILIDEMINKSILNLYVREKAQCYDLQGEWYKRQKLYKQAFDAYTNAKVIAESYNDIYLLKNIQEERCNLCEKIGEVDEGYKVQKELIQLLYEINEREIALTAMKLEIKNDINTMEEKANYDYLTGVYNRKYLETTTANWLKVAEVNNESIVCMILDIDKFKSINDEYGHLFGDEILKQVSKVCQKVITQCDLIARYGGDEFVAILKDASLEAGKKKAQQMLEAVRNLKIYKENDEILTTLSIGVADNRSCNAKNFQDLFSAADANLYKAKKNGKNQVV